MRNYNTVKSHIWVPSLYFAQGLPCIVVTLLCTLFLKNIGLPNLTVVSIVSMLSIPWVIKPVVSPFIEKYLTKRQWTLYVEVALAVVFAFISFALILKLSHFFIVLLLFLLAIFSAVHDAASDGVYLLSLNKTQQYSNVGLRNCSYQVSRLFCQGFMLMLVAVFERAYSINNSWAFIFDIFALVMLVSMLMHRHTLPKVETALSNSSASKKNIMVTVADIIKEAIISPNIILYILFVFFYNAAQVQIITIAPLYFISSVAKGGLGLGMYTLGVVQTVAVLCLVGGAFCLSYVSKKIQLSKIVMWATPVLILCDVSYIYLNKNSAPNLVLMVNSLSEFMFGFCNAAYMLVLLQQTSLLRYKTAFYSVSTAVMCVGYITFSYLGGVEQHYLGYVRFFECTSVMAVVISVFVYFYAANLVEKNEN